MNVTQFMSKMRNQIGFHLKENNVKNEDSDDAADDVMYEDFVVLTKDQIEEVSADGLPSYSNVMTEKYQKAPSFPAHSSTEKLHSQNTSKLSSTMLDSQCPLYSSVHNQTSAISDVPFEFHPSLCVQQRIRSIFEGVNLQNHSFNWAKYSHDFTQENLCLRNLSCGSEYKH